jgi:hypothetical protein
VSPSEVVEDATTSCKADDVKQLPLLVTKCHVTQCVTEQQNSTIIAGRWPSGRTPRQHGVRAASRNEGP